MAAAGPIRRGPNSRRCSCIVSPYAAPPNRRLDRPGAVRITNSVRVTGDFKSPVAVRGRAMGHFTMVLPFASSESWVATLVGKGVDRRANSFIRAANLSQFDHKIGLLRYALWRSGMPVSPVTVQPYSAWSSCGTALAPAAGHDADRGR